MYHYLKIANISTCKTEREWSKRIEEDWAVPGADEGSKCFAGGGESIVGELGGGHTGAVAAGTLGTVPLSVGINQSRADGILQ